MSWIYPVDNEEPSKAIEERQILARLGSDLLNGWNTPPGVNEDRSVEQEDLISWVNKARELARENHLGKYADYRIGQILARYPIGTDGIWPHETLRDLIEKLESEGIEDSIIRVRSTNWGAINQSIEEGGEQERIIAKRYRDGAHNLCYKWPRTARLLEGIADTYESIARREDKRSELIEDLYY